MQHQPQDLGQPSWHREPEADGSLPPQHHTASATALRQQQQHLQSALPAPARALTPPSAFPAQGSMPPAQSLPSQPAPSQPQQPSYDTSGPSNPPDHSLSRPPPDPHPYPHHLHPAPGSASQQHLGLDSRPAAPQQAQQEQHMQRSPSPLPGQSESDPGAFQGLGPVEEDVGVAAGGRRHVGIKAKGWAGSVVWAKLARYPWWPAQVGGCTRAGFLPRLAAQVWCLRLAWMPPCSCPRACCVCDSAHDLSPWHGRQGSVAGQIAASDHLHCLSCSLSHWQTDVPRPSCRAAHMHCCACGDCRAVSRCLMRMTPSFLLALSRHAGERCL